MGKESACNAEAEDEGSILGLGRSPGEFSSVAQSCPTLRPHELQQATFPVHHQLPEFTQTQVYLVDDAIEPSHPLSSSSALSLSQHQGLFQ